MDQLILVDQYWFGMIRADGLYTLDIHIVTWCNQLINLIWFDLVCGLELFLFFHILGMSSSKLTFIFFRGVGLNHQPVMLLQAWWETSFVTPDKTLWHAVTLWPGFNLKRQEWQTEHAQEMALKDWNIYPEKNASNISSHLFLYDFMITSSLVCVSPQMMSCNKDSTSDLGKLRNRDISFLVHVLKMDRTLHTFHTRQTFFIVEI